MKLFISFVVLIMVAYGARHDDDENYQNFLALYKKLYKNALEEEIRYSIYLKNLEHIEEHNQRFDQGLESFKMAINEFSDLTSEEFVTHTLNLVEQPFNKSQFKNSFEYKANKTEMESRYATNVFDWRARGAVTEVKNQKSCGSCWTFSTTGAIEGAYAIKTGQLVEFSEQNLLDCVKNNWGCTSGWPSTAMDFVIQNGITTEQNYPYKGVQNSQCNYYNPVTMISNVGFVTEGDEYSLERAIYEYGPVSVALDARLFQYYSNGIYDVPNCAQNNFNHAILAVGYGTENGRDYYICKNSWGKGWGENGYIRMSRNKNNQCGIASRACFPEL